MPNPTRPVIRVVAAVMVDAAGRILLVRKRGTAMFMQPGGKPEPGEPAAAALARELHEELAVTADPSGFVHLGHFCSTAANEAGHDLEAEMFVVPPAADAIASAEIEELRWVHPDEIHTLPVAPLVHDHVLAVLRPSE